MPKTHRRKPTLFLLAFGVLAVAGCTTVKPLPPADLSASGWNVRQGQAIWKSQGNDLAGELILADRTDGSSVVQFIKTPLPIVSAQTRGSRWTITFVADDRTISGKGTAPVQLLWLHLGRALRRNSLPKPLAFKGEAGGNWELRNNETGESISGFLNP